MMVMMMMMMIIIIILIILDSVWIKMDQLTFCPLMYTPFVLQI